MAWGIGATALGVVIATDFRGAARRVYGLAARSVWSAAHRDPSRRAVAFLRAGAGLFALAGPIALAWGVFELSRRRQGPGFPERFPTPVIVMWFLIAAVGLLQLWTRSGWLRRACAKGGTLRRAAAAVLTAAMVGSVAAGSFGQPVTMLCCWLVGMSAALTLLLTGKELPANP
ncbi:hypothetical protein [Streptodolium elevatio]